MDDLEFSGDITGIHNIEVEKWGLVMESGTPSNKDRAYIHIEGSSPHLGSVRASLSFVAHESGIHDWKQSGSRILAYFHKDQLSEVVHLLESESGAILRVYTSPVRGCRLQSAP